MMSSIYSSTQVRNAANTPYLVSILRLLWLRDTCPDTWSRVDQLMDHVEDTRLNAEAWAIQQVSTSLNAMNQNQ